MSPTANWTRMRRAWRSAFRRDPLAPLVETARRLDYGAGRVPAPVTRGRERPERR
ncbi:hypothetical protein [Streptomyces dysideae]|uniref:hypothetical protein n=1 Tax=Streptomyces dysideae TaxID=909626 RepID=UPI00131B19A2|nr:hypothetical protein [Streptomyces dysideae]